jgi:2-polyprenyl-3-methyl-5-hydroxy-6-metoxy-1,4-benzoquinol methylase
MSTSKDRETSYKGFLENGPAGLNTDAFVLFRKYVSPAARVLDLGSGSARRVERMHDASHAVTACDLKESSNNVAKVLAG